MKISLCIPLFNEQKILIKTMDEVSSYMKGRFGEDYEVIYVDDGSTDESLEILDRKKDAKTKVISYRPNRGKGYAVRSGMLSASGEIVIFTDCDLAYGTEVIGKFFDEMERDGSIECLIGSRALHPLGYDGYSSIRRLLSKGYLRFLSLYAGLRPSDSQCGIKAFRQTAAQSIFSRAEVDRFAFDLEVILLAQRLGMKISEHPVRILNHRESTVHFVKDSVRMVRDVRKIKNRIKKIKI